MTKTTAIVVVRDAELASSLELALLAAGLNAIVEAPTRWIEELPLDRADTLIVDQGLMNAQPAVYLATLRARPWLGLVILITGDRKSLSPGLETIDRVTVLEMPFQGADLIAAIRSDRTESGRPTPTGGPSQTDDTEDPVQ